PSPPNIMIMYFIVWSSHTVRSGGRSAPGRSRRPALDTATKIFFSVARAAGWGCTAPDRARWDKCTADHRGGLAVRPATVGRARGLGGFVPAAGRDRRRRHDLWVLTSAAHPQGHAVFAVSARSMRLSLVQRGNAKWNYVLGGSRMGEPPGERLAAENA